MYPVLFVLCFLFCPCPLLSKYILILVHCPGHNNCHRKGCHFCPVTLSLASCPGYTFELFAICRSNHFAASQIPQISYICQSANPKLANFSTKNIKNETPRLKLASFWTLSWLNQVFFGKFFLI
jgi:hypothetical protein